MRNWLSLCGYFYCHRKIRPFDPKSNNDPQIEKARQVLSRLVLLLLIRQALLQNVQSLIDFLLCNIQQPQQPQLCLCGQDHQAILRTLDRNFPGIQTFRNFNANHKAQPGHPGYIRHSQ